ncbi:hypothetical protein AVT17_gp100 [Mycobacterium phage Ariel]|uniref:hypothetical protein n=1 Tax=Mycobacterium phage Ariel TaxID=1541824 RepID=UPI0004F8B082|nr:hypothetical protein AVT17_gp100 [Mycobacterium phage Ariel]AIM49977.1 hypothetical protein PBI_ARIEL_100 [Mycobacterium phage Ariel]
MLQGPEKAARGDIETSPLAARRVDPLRWRIKLTHFLCREICSARPEWFGTNSSRFKSLRAHQSRGVEPACSSRVSVPPRDFLYPKSGRFAHARTFH